MGSLIVAPLVYEGRPVGTLTVMRSLDRPDYAPEDVRLVASMAAQASVAIEQARLNDATRQALAEVQTLYELARVLGAAVSLDELLQAIVDTVAAKLPADRVSLFGVDMDEREVVHAHRGGREAGRVFLEVPFEELLEGLTGWAMRYGRPAVSPKGAADNRESDKVQRRREETRAGSIVAVPLRYRGGTLGTLTAINDVDGPDFGDGDVALLQAMANQAAVAITDARLLAEVQRLAVTDNLTGIANRGHFLDLAAQEFASARRYRRPLGAIMLDVDQFKHINDTWGHAVGDEVLRQVVRRCGDTLRAPDIFGRYGGEEFAVVLPETGLEATRSVAHRLCDAVAAAAVATPDGPVPVTISLGVAHISQGVDSLPALLERADAALLAAKRSGRNQVGG